ncbi:MAG: O-antigen ligase family protein [Pirellulales bacterium]|nr:O-antigen ligase family protein [Pirellulales bacterium]
METLNRAIGGHRHASRSARRRARQHDVSPVHWLDAPLLRLMDAGLAACLLVVPFLMGGRHPIGQVALVGLTSIVVLAWALRQAVGRHGTWQPTHAAFLLLFGVFLLVLQLTPLPYAWLAKLSPRVVDLLPLWAPGADPLTRLGTWSRISLTPDATRAALILFVSYGLLFLVTVQRVGRVEDIERILRWCALAAVLMGGFGLVQYLTANGKFFWFHEAPYADTLGEAKGSFTNRNHFAHFLALGIGPLVWWLHSMYRGGDQSGQRRFSTGDRGLTRERVARFLLISAVTLVVFASLLSLSRGGNSVMFLAATIAAVVCGRAAAVRGRFLFSVIVAGLLIIGSLNLFGYESVSSRLSDLSSGSLGRLDQNETRRTVWAAAVKAIPDFALLGSGVGSHREVCPIYVNKPLDGVVFTHAENGYLQEPLETGFLGALLLAGGIAFCVFWCIGGLRGPSARLRACVGAIAASLAASLVHALVDFVWYVPACTAMVAVLAGLACRGWQLARPPDQAVRPWSLSRAGAIAMAVVVLFASVGMVKNRYRAAIAQCYWEKASILARTPAAQANDLRGGEVLTDRQLEINKEERILGLLENVVRWYPEHAGAHISLARSHLHLFDLLQMTAVNPMPLPQIRDAAIASQAHFPSRQARDDWMRRAFGEHCDHLNGALTHTRAGLRGCPLQGRGYLYLAELCFLDGATPQSKNVFVDQALRVRPFDGHVLDAAARETYEALLAGDLRSWLSLAQRTLQSERSCKKRLLESIIQNTSPEGLEMVIGFMVTELKPDLEGLTFLYEASKKRGRPDQLRQLQGYYARMAEFNAQATNGDEAGKLWSIAAKVYNEMGDHDNSLRCAREAYAQSPGALNIRYRLACLLLDAGNGAEARSHLQWCLHREPDNQTFQKQYRRAIESALTKKHTASHRTGTIR